METRQKQMSAVLSNKLNAVSREKKYQELCKYIETKKNYHYLTISEKECIKMGFSASEYRKIIVDLNNVNRHATNAVEIAEKEMRTRNPQKTFFFRQNKRKNRGERFRCS